MTPADHAARLRQLATYVEDFRIGARDSLEITPSAAHCRAAADALDALAKENERMRRALRSALEACCWGSEPHDEELKLLRLNAIYEARAALEPAP